MSDEMLSQDEINALLKSNTTEENIEKDSDSIEENIEKDSNSKEEIEESYMLTDIEKDALGEIGNISMGNAATTLSTLLNKKVNITTPTVEETTAEKLASEYETPLVAVDVSYSEGLEGSNIMILKTDDVKIITDLMMGKEDIDTERELTELDLSAAGEAMNQMMGSSATSLSSMLNKKIDIKPPKAEEVSFTDDKQIIDFIKSESPLIKVSFKMEIGEYIDSNIMQLIPIDFGKQMVSTLMSSTEDSSQNIDQTDTIAEEIEEKIEVEPKNNINSHVETSGTNVEKIMDIASKEKVVVSQPNFPQFDKTNMNKNISEIDLVGDIPVEITVELGRTNKKIAEILEFGVGTILELDKLVGEPLKILANGKYIASGEVVVIDDNFGIRITDIETDRNII